MRKNLIDSNWIDEYVKLSNEAEVKPEAMWISLKSKLLDLRNEFVPLGNCNDNPTWRSRNSIPIDKDIRNAIKEKETSHRSWI